MRNLHEEILSMQHKSNLVDFAVIRDRLIDLLNKYIPLKDSHFDNEICLGVEKFQQRFFEAYLGNFFLDKNLVIESQDYGPDFIIDGIGIECIAVTNGESENLDSVPKMHINNIVI